MIKSFNYIPVLKKIFEEINDAVKKVLESGNLILGPETERFELEFSRFSGSQHCIGVSSGTSALIIALMALGIGEGDEVITVSNTCVPTVSAIETVGAKPVFIDVGEIDLMMNAELIENAITERTKAIIPVHLWGQSVEIDKISAISKKHGLKVIEDCAQATGTLFQNRHVGNFGDVGCFSFYPTKNLGAYGDAGAVVTDNKELAEKLKKIRTYGYDENRIAHLLGTNARIAEIQAAILRVKLQYLSGWLKRKIEIADFYVKKISNKNIRLPHLYKNRTHSFHQFVVRTENRDKLGQWLNSEGIEYGIHYQTPVHKMPYFKKRWSPMNKLVVTENAANEILSIPVHEALSDEDAGMVVEAVNNF